jgi:hypothetical protein
MNEIDWLVAGFYFAIGVFIAAAILGVAFGILALVAEWLRR